MAENGKRYLAVVELKGDSTLQRIASDVPKIIAFLSQFSKGEHQQAFRSKDGLLFGFFFKAAKVIPSVLQAEFEKCPGTMTGDSFMVIEIGESVTGTSGFSRAWTWLQHH